MSTSIFSPALTPAATLPKHLVWLKHSEVLYKTENCNDLIEFTGFVISLLKIFHVINKYAK